LNLTKIIGHRGTKESGCIENTLSAFEAAFELGCDGVELDVHLSKDKEWVIHHDNNIKRLMIHNTDLIHLQNKTDELGYELATLREVLKKFQMQELNIDVKPNSFKLGAYLGEFLKKYGNPKNHIVGSFKQKTLQGVRSTNNNLRISMLTPLIISNQWKSLHHEIQLYSVNPFYNFASKYHIYQIMKSGIMVQPWTVNNSKSIKKFLALKVDAIITDKPKMAISERNKISE
jgi:glycerophosphoryl diester phosphodiesterase